MFIAKSNFIQTNLNLLSRKRNSNTYNEGATKICNIGRDKWNLFDVANILEVASLSREEPELDATFLMIMERETIWLFLANCFLIWYFDVFE